MNPSLALVEEDEELPHQGQEAETARAEERRERRRAHDLDRGVVVDELLQFRVVPDLGPSRVALAGSDIRAETAPSAQITVIILCLNFVLFGSQHFYFNTICYVSYLKHELNVD